jgi:hypothetical protein
MKKFILLFLVLFILVVPFSAFAHDISLPPDLPAQYYLVYYDTTRYMLICTDVQFYKEGSALAIDGTQRGYYAISYDGTTWESIGYDGGLFRPVTYTDDRISFSTIVAANYDIIDSDTGEVFFSPPLPPSLMEIVATQVQELPLVLLSQVRVILVGGILVLSLVILVGLLRKGLIIFFPR